MSQTSSAKSIPAVIGGIILAAAAAYFGIDFGDQSTSSAATDTSAVSSSTAVTSASASKAANLSAAGDEDTCPLLILPAEAEDVVGDILAGGPFEYPDNDGVRFGNYEGVLPKESRNYYREYTVDTPGLNHRGERRIVTGGGTETDPEVWYYTDDHYETFCLIPDAED